MIGSGRTRKSKRMETPDNPKYYQFYETWLLKQIRDSASVPARAAIDAELSRREKSLREEREKKDGERMMGAAYTKMGRGRRRGGP